MQKRVRIGDEQPITKPFPILVRAATKMCMRPEKLIEAIVKQKGFTNSEEVIFQNVQRWREGNRVADYIESECLRMLNF